MFVIVKVKWTMENFIEIEIEKIRQRVRRPSCIMCDGGGVDSSVVAVLLHKAMGDQLHVSL